jgi:hypothetical protein
VHCELHVVCILQLAHVKYALALNFSGNLA